MNIQVECRDKTLIIQAGEMTLTIVSPHSLASLGIEDGSPAEILSWVGMTFFAQRPATITPLSLDGEPCGIDPRSDCGPCERDIPHGEGLGIVWEYAIFPSLWSLTLEAGPGYAGGPDLFQEMAAVLSLCLYSLAEVGQRLGRSRRMITQHLHRGRFPGVMRVGRMWLVHALALGVYRLGMRRRGRPTLRGRDSGESGD